MRSKSNHPSYVHPDDGHLLKCARCKENFREKDLAWQDYADGTDEHLCYDCEGSIIDDWFEKNFRQIEAE